ncbi:hypothetical protein MMC11_006470 [Xylographa trunciseda]|nr:hypothetical protein [Xylographa trunciseda]
MTVATTSRSTPRTPWSSHSHARTHQKSSTTPLGPPSRTPASVGQSLSPLHSAKIRSPLKQHQGLRSPSPNYFGFIVETSNNPADSNAGGHVKSNWSPPSSIVRSTAVNSPKVIPVDSIPEYEAFRRQSESNSFSLSHGNLSHFSMGGSSDRLPTLGNLAQVSSPTELASPRSYVLESKITTARPQPQENIESDHQLSMSQEPGSTQKAAPSFFGLPRNESPMNVPGLPSQISHIDDRHPRLSLPQNKAVPLCPSGEYNPERAETLPSSLKADAPMMITSQNLAVLLEETAPENILLLDLRVSPQFTQSRINGAMNLCIPTTLLKRPSYNVQRLADTFTQEAEKEKFSQWRGVSYIVLYDANSTQLKDATSSLNTLKKFTQEGWHGASYVVRGGFLDFAKKFPELIDQSAANGAESLGKSNLSIDSRIAGSMPVAGGCPMPTTKTAANPFFGNIRQNMDLIGGVGQMAIKHPATLTDRVMEEMPKWLREAANENDKGKVVSERFLNIEKAEQQRMQKALSTHVSYGSPTVRSPESIQIAGIEKGTKNRYKDMLPYDHSRVRLQNVPFGGCDYINASHIKAAWSYRHYIATQAPVPATFEDFWRVVWEQDARVIVMLTAETEGGQRKSHPYWLPDNYGPLKLKALSEKRVSLESSNKLSPSTKAQVVSPSDRPGMGRRRATNPLGATLQDVAPSPTSEIPHVVIRKLTLSHSAYPFLPLREITQLQYSSWPDFGAPAHPSHVLGLVEHCNAVVRNYAGSEGRNSQLPAKEGERPIVVHCSAGCGRTGTFCTVDSVLDILKRQRMVKSSIVKTEESQDEMDIDEEDWVKQDSVDLVAKTVEDLRLQRLSMVQTLRQFVLCYETVLEWLVKEMPEKLKKEGSRRSYQG